MKLSKLSPSTVGLILALPLLASAALQSARSPRPDEFEPFRMHIGADSIPDFVSSRNNPYEISRSNQPNPGNDGDNFDAVDRAIAATVDIGIEEVQIHGDDMVPPGSGTVRRTQKVVIGSYQFDPPMEIVDVKIDGGPNDLTKVECFFFMRKRGQYIKFGLGMWTSAADATSVYCRGYYAIEEESA